MCKENWKYHMAEWRLAKWVRTLGDGGALCGNGAATSNERERRWSFTVRGPDEDVKAVNR